MCKRLVFIEPSPFTDILYHNGDSFRLQLTALTAADLRLTSDFKLDKHWQPWNKRLEKLALNYLHTA